MEALEFIKIAKDGKIIIDVPEALEGKEVKVQITQYDVIDNPENWHKLPGTEKVEILKRFAGKDKFPDAKVDKYDVYEQ